MKATQQLERQHRTMERAVDACEIFSKLLQSGRTVPAEALRELANFFRVYGEEYHQEQEEWLLGMLMNKGVARGSCPIAALTHEDQKCTMLINQLAGAVDVYARSANAVTGTLISTLQALAEVYPDHIWKEDYLLLPMADKLLSDQDQQALSAFLARVRSARGDAAEQAVKTLCATIADCPECSTLQDKCAA